MLPDREDHQRQRDKLLDVSASAERHERDIRALDALKPGMGAEGGGVRGFIGETYPERGEVFIESYDEGATVPASQARPTDPAEKARFERATGIAERRESIEELADRFGV